MTRVRVLYYLIVVAVVRQDVLISPPEVLVSADKKGPLARGVVLNRESPVHITAGSDGRLVARLLQISVCVVVSKWFVLFMDAPHDRAM